MERQPGQNRQLWLANMVEIIRRKYRIPPECNNHFRFDETGRARRVGPGLQTLYHRTVARPCKRQGGGREMDPLVLCPLLAR